MSELNLNIQTSTGQPFLYVPDTLLVKVLSVDMEAQTANVYFMCKDSTVNQDPNKYVWRRWVDEGEVKIPLSVIGSLKNTDGSINYNVVNAVISGFNLVAIQDSN